VLTYGTSVTLGIAGTLDDIGDDRFIQDIPLVFMQVADPFATRIAESFEGSGRANVTGTFNRVPEEVNIEVIRTYDPSFRRLGLLYNGNEANSLLKRDELQRLSETMGFELVAIELDPGNDGAPDPAMIPLRMAELEDRGVDFMYLGSSSFLRINAALFTASAVANGIAILSPYENLVRDYDALLSIAARAFDVGELAAKQALRILVDGETPGDIPIAQATDFAYVVNMRIARELARFPPFEFMQIAETTE
jgi:putative ABC transport system substrate-binding protein